MEMQSKRATVIQWANAILDELAIEHERGDIEAAFASHRDPLAGASPETRHDQLFRRIVMLVPAPLGLGVPLDG